jgi:hypothetical protein
MERSLTARSFSELLPAGFDVSRRDFSEPQGELMNGASFQKKGMTEALA